MYLSPPVHSEIFFAFVSLNFDPLLSHLDHGTHCRIVPYNLFVGYTLEERVVGALVDVPIVKFFDICNSVKTCIWFEEVSVLCKQIVANNASSMVFCFKVGVGKAKEHLLYL